MWDENKDVLVKLGFSKHNFDIIAIEDFDSGSRYRQIVNSVVYDFYCDRTQLNWNKNDFILLLELLNWEFKYGPESMDDEYVPVFVYRGTSYSELSKSLILDIWGNSESCGELISTPPNRQYFLLFKRVDGDDTSCFDYYHTMMYDFLK